MIKNIVCDFGKVLVDYNFDLFLSTIFPNRPEEMKEFEALTCSKGIPLLLIFNNGREEPVEIIIYQHLPKIKYYILYHIVEFLLNCCFSILPDHLPCLSPAVPSTWHRAMALPEPALPEPALLPDHLPRRPPAAAVLPRSAVPLGCCAVLRSRRAGARAGLRIF